MIFSALLVATCVLLVFTAKRDVKLGIYLTLFALPSYLIRFHIGPIPFTLLEVFVLIVFVLCIVRKESRQTLLEVVRSDRLFLLGVCLLIAGAIGVVVSPDGLAALGSFRAYFFEPLLFYVVIRSQIKSPADVEHALMALGASAIVTSIFALIQWITGLGIPIPWDIEHRVTSFYDFPNAVGLFLGPIVTIAALLTLQPGTTPGVVSSNKQRGFWAIVTILGMLAILAAKTEAAYVAIPASLFIIALAHFPSLQKRGRRWSSFALAAVAVLGIVVALAITPVRQKLTLNDYSGEVRRTQWSETIAMLKDRPVFGAGLSGYPITFKPYHDATWIEIFQYPHNIVLNIWSELGLLGLLIFVFLALQTLRLVRGSTDLFSLVIFGALVEMTIHGFVDVPYFKNDLALMTWALLGLLVITRRAPESD